MRSTSCSNSGAGRRLAAAALFALALPAAASSPDLVVGAAWHGVSRPDRPTELRVRLPSDPAAELTVEAGGRRIVAHLERTGLAVLPVPALERLAVDVRLGDGRELRSEFRPALAERPLVAASVPVAVGEDYALLPVDAGAFPDAPGAYAAVDAVVVDAPTLAALTAAQQLALVADLARCGRLVAVGVGEAAGRALADAAGCGGRSLALAPDPPAAAEALVTLFGRTLPEPPAPAALASLAPDERRPLTFTIIGLVAYALAVALAVAFARRRYAPAALAVLGTVLAVLVLRGLGPTATVSIWAEQAAGDRRARYDALEAVASRGRHPAEVALPALLEAASTCESEAGEPEALWRYSLARRRFESIAFEARLFDRREVCFSGVFPTARTARAEHASDGSWRITNGGAGAWPAASFLHGGSVSAVEPLAAGAHRALVAAAAPSTPADALAAGRVDEGLRFPLDLPALGASHTRAVASLLVRLDPPGGP